MDHDEMASIARRAAARYARRCWWADKQELEQEAWVAMLRARKTFDPQVGVPFGGYAWRAVVVSLSSYLWRQSAPVSAGDRDLEELAGIHRAPLEAAANVAQALDVEELVDCVRRARLVRDVIDLHDEDGHARAVLLGERRPQEVARESAGDVSQVYRSTQRARSALGTDAELWYAWRDHV